MVVADTLQSAEAILEKDGRQLTLVDEDLLLNDVAQPLDDINCYFIDEFSAMCEIPSDKGEIFNVAAAEQTSKTQTQCITVDHNYADAHEQTTRRKKMLKTISASSTTSDSSKACASEALNKAINIGQKFNSWRSNYRTEGENTTSVDKLSSNEQNSIIVAMETSDVNKLVSCLMKIPVIDAAIVHYIMLDINAAFGELNKRVHGYVSVLMKKDSDYLKNMAWDKIFEEASGKIPRLIELLIAAMLKPNQLISLESVQNIVPKIGLIYSIMASSFNNELSLVKRVISIILHDNCCDRAVSFL